MYDCLLVMAFTLLYPQTGHLTFSFVLNEGPLSHEDEGWMLVERTHYCGMCGHRYEVKWLLSGRRDWPAYLYRRITGKRYLVSLFVDLNSLSPADLMAAIDRIRSTPGNKGRAMVVFRFARCALPGDHPPLVPGTAPPPTP